MTLNLRVTTKSQIPRGLRAALGAHDRLYRTFIASAPHLGVRLAEMIGQTASRFNCYGPTAREVQAIFGPLPRRDQVRIARAISALTIKNHASNMIVESAGHDTLAELVICASDDRLQALHEAKQPAVLVMMHIGSQLGICSALHRLGIPVLVLTKTRRHRGRTSLEVLSDIATPMGRAFALKTACDKLNAGGMVLMTLDGAENDPAPVPFFRSHIDFHRGTGVLARMARVPVIPITGRWTDEGMIAVRLHDPLPTPPLPASRRDHAEFEHQVNLAAASFFEQFLRAHPTQMSLLVLRRIIARQHKSSRI